MAKSVDVTGCATGGVMSVGATGTPLPSRPLTRGSVVSVVVVVVAAAYLLLDFERSQCHTRIVQAKRQCREKAESSMAAAASSTRLKRGGYGVDLFSVHNPNLADPTPAVLAAGDGPRVAWLMSFPNSGTSYTSELVQELSNTTGGSNYIEECHIEKLGERGTPTFRRRPYPIFTKESPENGPFISQLPLKPLPPSGSYILTKTHCGGYTVEDGPNTFIETPHSFAVQCRTGTAYTDPTKHSPLKRVTYSPDFIARAIHIVRDPFDNAVSRFHNTRNAHKGRGGEDDYAWMERYTDDAQGFNKWCLDEMDQIHYEEERQSRFIDDELFELLKVVPCHEEFYRYVQWHNLAIATIRKMKLPSLLLYYEDYETRFDDVVQEMFDFLKLERNGTVAPFKKGKTYRQDYFTPHHRRLAWNVIDKLASPETWHLLKRYMEY